VIPTVFKQTSSHPIIIAHRGACGILPEQTLEAFDLAIQQGANTIELDIVPTRDGILLARHENELSLTTNVSDEARLSARRTTRLIDAGAMTGWFTEDLTADEIQTLRARQRFEFRDHSHDHQFAIPTLDDVLRWKDRQSKKVGVFIEIKHPTYFTRIGLDPTSLLLRTLESHGLNERESGIVLMSFETRVLRELRDRTPVPLVQLLDAPQAQPFDWAESKDPRTYADLINPAGLKQISTYADGIGPWKRLIVPACESDTDGMVHDRPQLARPTSLIADAHAAGLFVCSWTFRDESRFLAADYADDPAREYRQFSQLKINGLITDYPATATAALI
jgi:glycerophosphoryl diester phosphodiesterase